MARESQERFMGIHNSKSLLKRLIPAHTRLTRLECINIGIIVK